MTHARDAAERIFMSNWGVREMETHIQKHIDAATADANKVIAELRADVEQRNLEIVELRVYVRELRQRLLSAAGDDLCRLSQEEIEQLTSGAVPIPPKPVFLESCGRFHDQIAGEAGVNHNCLTLAQLIAENERLNLDREGIKKNFGTAIVIIEELINNHVAPTPEARRVMELLSEIKKSNELYSLGREEP